MKNTQLTLAVAIGAALITSSYAQTNNKGPAKHRYGVSQATAIALKKYPGKLVGKVPLENEEGKWEYAVSILSGKTLREVMVGADSGKIENVEVTTAAEEAKEAKGDAMKLIKVRKSKKHGG